MTKRDQIDQNRASGGFAQCSQQFVGVERFVVEKRGGARRGDIVVAIVDNQFTLKRLDLERGRFILRPENKAYPVIRPEGSLEIFGVMVGLVRKTA